MRGARTILWLQDILTTRSTVFGHYSNDFFVLAFKILDPPSEKSGEKNEKNNILGFFLFASRVDVDNKKIVDF